MGAFSLATLGYVLGGAAAAAAAQQVYKAVVAPRIWSDGHAAPELAFGSAIAGKQFPYDGRYVEGGDISIHQGDNDFVELAKWWDFCIIKSTEGLSIVDPKFSRNWSECNGRMVRGAYHYAHLKESPIEQVKKMRAVVGELGPLDLPPSIDVEWQGNEGLRDPKAFVHWMRVAAHVAADLFGRRLMVYTSIGYWSYVGNPVAPDLGQLPLWAAHHTTGARPLLPSPWASVLGANGWAFWQYSGGEVAPGAPTPRIVPGIGNKRPVDLDRFPGTLADLQAFVERTKL